MIRRVVLCITKPEPFPSRWDLRKIHSKLSHIYPQPKYRIQRPNFEDPTQIERFLVSDHWDPVCN